MLRLDATKQYFSSLEFGMKKHTENLYTAMIKMALMFFAATTPVFNTACRRSNTEAPPQIVVESLSSPAPVGSVVPQVSVLHDGGMLLSWVEPRPDSGYTFCIAVQRKEQWSAPQIIASDTKMIMYAVILPSVTPFPNGMLLAHWDIHLPEDKDPYSNLIHVARSLDGGKTWSAPIVPHRDGVSGSHSFASTFPAGDSIGLVWLDARRQRHVPPPPGAGDDEAHSHGAIGLQWTTVASNGGLGADVTIDSMACECCPTAAAITSRGPVVVYRDRQPMSGEVRDGQSEIRDIHLIRLEQGRWTLPLRVHADNWIIDGCPDNGPAVDASGERVAVAWWTAAGDSPMVKVAFSENNGNSFGKAFRLDQGNGDGQVTVTLLKNGAIIGWLEQGETWVRWIAPDGQMSAAVSLGPSPIRSRLPRWIEREDAVIAVWTSQMQNDERQVRISKLRLVAPAS
jgi:hypothetical protein